ncbi:unnamed protein product [Phyllotreta striolata]|uniref:Uncharacterized protein n=1 Tax=Phyllotreta striolata TaxID=444603 RepID=A0A9N9XJM8_PHYSR|nr:unnamed protein product [Phyllotreta striolata]
MIREKNKNTKKNPRERANCFSLITFWYITDLIKKGYYKKTIEEDDLYEVTKRCESKTCGDRIEEEYRKQKTGGKPPSLFHVLYKIYGFRYLLWGITQLIAELINRIMQPNAVSNLVYYFTPGQTKMTKFDAILNAGMLLFANLYQKMYFHNYDLFLNLIGIEVRTSLCSFLFRKVLKLSPAAVSQANLGNVVTLITKDVQQIKRTIFIFNDSWVFTLTVCTTCFLLYLKIGAVSLIASGVFICAIPLEVLIGKFINKLRTETCEKTDQRLQLTQEILTAIKIIKMYAWEEFFERKIDSARRKEVAKMLIVFYLRMILMLIGTIVSKIGLYLLIMGYIWMDEPTDASVVFFITAHFETLRIYFAHLLPSSFGKIAEFSTTLSRINKVLQTEEINTDNDFSNTPTPSIHLDNVTIAIDDKEIIKNIYFNAITGLTLITGKVGSGKSLLLKTMLQEYPLKGGTLRVEGKISYASQNPWLFPSTIKQNILFGEKFDANRYAEVLRVCALKYDLNLFEKGDETILTDNGQNLSKGQQARVNLARAVYKQSDIYLLDDCLSALDAHVRNFIYNECIKNFLSSKICLLITQDESKFDREDVFAMNDGVLQKYSSDNSIKDSSELRDLNESSPEEIGFSEFESHETDELLETEQTVHENIYEEQLKQGGVDAMVYKKYISHGGGLLILLMNLLLIGFNQASDSYCEKLLSVWSDEKQRVLNLQINITISSTNSSELRDALETADSRAASTFRTYTIMLAVAVVLELVRTYTFLDFCRRASIRIHESMVRTVLHAAVTFFDSHFIGNILNRFSQDITNVDENLPFELSGSLGVLFSVGGAVALLVSVNPYFLIYALLLFCTYLIYSKIYLPIARNLQRLEASTRSPMIGHLNAALEGATTIRAFRAENLVINEYEKRQDVFTSAHYTLMNFQYAFAFFMQTMAAAMVTMVVSTFILFDTDASAGNIGLGLMQVLSLGSLVQTTLKSWADLESTMTATERALEYTGIKTESKKGTISNNWPNKATIKYENVSLSYNANEIVLDELNFSVDSKEKIGIVGRTGAGKSSIVSTIFRLYDVEGTILIDGVNIGSLPLEFLRRNLAIIPQDPVLFSGSIRSNLDPFRKSTDEELWTVLERTHLKRFIARLDADARASNFSLGQKQMVCVARAILADARIVVLDEATANLDPDTERLIRRTISENFAECTVLIIAHRLETVLECDKIMVLDRGRIVEFDQPGVLLQDNNGWLSRMISRDDVRRKSPLD